MSLDIGAIRGIEFRQPEPEEVRESVTRHNDSHREGNKLVRNRCVELEKIYQTSESHKAYDKEQIKEAINKELGNFLEFAQAIFKQKEKPYFVQNAMSNLKFVKRMLELTEGNQLLAPMINDLIHNFFTFQNMFSKEKVGEHYDEIVDLYWSTYVNANQKYIAKIAKKAGITEEVAATVAIAVPKNLTDIPRDHYSVQRYTFMLLNNLYLIASKQLKVGDNAALDDPDTIRKIIKQVFKNDQPDTVIRTILLERDDKKAELNDNQKAVWSTVDIVVLDWLESFDQKHLREFLIDYGFKRLNSRGRRINLQEHIPQSDYPNILQTIDKIIQDKPKIKDSFK